MPYFTKSFISNSSKITAATKSFFTVRIADTQMHDNGLFAVAWNRRINVIPVCASEGSRQNRKHRR